MTNNEIRTGFSNSNVEDRINAFLERHMKDNDFDREAAFQEVFEHVIYGNNSYHYELGSFWTKSGNPEVLDFNDLDFIYDQINFE